jgi:hypothetical protein
MPSLKMKRREWAESSKDIVSHNENLPEEAHAKNFSTFTEHCTSFRENELSLVEPGDLWNASGQSLWNGWIELLKLNAGIWGPELPINNCVNRISLGHDGLGLLFEEGFVCNVLP